MHKKRSAGVSRVFEMALVEFVLSVFSVHWLCGMWYSEVSQVLTVFRMFWNQNPQGLLSRAERMRRTSTRQRVSSKLRCLRGTQ